MNHDVLRAADLPTTPEYPCDRRSISDAADLGTVAAAFYDIAPGEQLPRTYHYHDQREELFVVLEGVLSVETPDGDVEVETGAVFVAEPGTPHRAYNPDSATEPVRVVGVGAPKYDVARPYDPDSGDSAAETGSTGTGTTE